MINDGISVDRNLLLRKHISKDMLGIECGPWKSPLCPKRDGYRCQVLDVFTTDQLLERAKLDPNINEIDYSNIETVDLVGSAQNIYKLVMESPNPQTYDYVVSSHNFEHIPDPILFIQGAGQIINSGGFVSMAMPNKAYCFDLFRRITATSDFLKAHFEKRTIPSNDQIFDHMSNYVQYNAANGSRPWFIRGEDLSNLVVNKALKHSYDLYLRRVKNSETDYLDVHCWTFTPPSFQLLIKELWLVGLIPFDVHEIFYDVGCEFIVHLKNIGYNKEEISDLEYDDLLKLKLAALTYTTNLYG